MAAWWARTVLPRRLQHVTLAVCFWPTRPGQGPGTCTRPIRVPQTRGALSPHVPANLGRLTGIEPASPGPQPGALPLSYSCHDFLVGQSRIELASRGYQPRALPLSYWPDGAGGRNRTAVSSLAKTRTTPVRHPRLGSWESDPDHLFQRQACYRCTTPHWWVLEDSNFSSTPASFTDNRFTGGQAEQHPKSWTGVLPLTLRFARVCLRRPQASAGFPQAPRRDSNPPFPFCLVDRSGIEPLTFSLQTRRSPN